MPAEPSRVSPSVRASNGHSTEVFSARELASAAGVSTGVIEDLISGAEIATVDGEHVAFDTAVETLRALESGGLRVDPAGGRPGVFGSALARRQVDPRSRRMSALMSTTLHAAVIIIVTVLATARLTTAANDASDFAPVQLSQLIFVAEPGPGGGGGGGGLRMPTPPSVAERAGTDRLRSPAPERVKPIQIEPPAAPEPPPPLENESLPPILAPLMTANADSRSIRGLLDEARNESAAESLGPGLDGGVGSGGGTGIGPGSGAGVGPGFGGGTGGGPYRAGSGITPPRLVFEERPHYTETARQRGIEGYVVLELVVLRDGSVGDIRIIRRLGAGLDEQALQAVRQWRFLPAERLGSPVDVVVEVAVEFKLR